MSPWLEFEIELPLREFPLIAAAVVDVPVLGVFGASGSGKTSLLHSLLGIRALRRGFVRLEGEVLDDSEQRVHVPTHRRRLGVVFQDHLVFPHLSVAQNLRYGLRRIPKAERRFDFDEIVELLELGSLLERRPAQLSGGERQRVGLGRALLASPRALLLDEPLSSLDRQLRGKTLRFLRRVIDELQVPMLWVSHSLSEMRELTEHLIVLERGRIVAQGRYGELVRGHHAGLPWQDLGIHNLLQVEVREHDEAGHMTRCEIAGQSLCVPGLHGVIGESLALSVDAHEVALSLSAVHGTSIQNDLSGPIQNLDVGEERVLVEVGLGEDQLLLVEISHGALQQLELSEGLRVHCLIKARSLIPRFEDRVD
jgi:molybdate transport system ATP-binding protein